MMLDLRRARQTFAEDPQRSATGKSSSLRSGSTWATRRSGPLVEMYRRHELRLVRIGDLDAARADLAARGLRIDLVDESSIVDGDMTFHAVVIS